MSIEHNKETVRRYIEEVLSNFDYSRVDDVLHPEFYAHPGDSEITYASHRDHFAKMREMTPNMKNTLQSMVAEGDTVAAVSVWTNNEPPGMPKNPDGMKVCAVYQLKDGKIIAGEVYGTGRR